MSVLFETSVGDIVVDLETELCPRACTNFIKLAKSYYYNYATFFSVQPRFLAQSGDPTNSGIGGESIWSRAAATSSVLAPRADRYFVPEMPASLKHRARGTLSLALLERPDPAHPGEKQLVAGSQFFITLANGIDYLDGRHAVIGRVVEGGEPGGALDKLDAAFVDEQNRPLTDIRIRGISVLDDPFPDPPGLRIPSRTPSPTPEQLASIRLSEAEAAQKDDAELAPEEREQKERLKNSKTAALTLEMVGDLPFAEIRPPENILFICKLNPVTRSEDLELIFSRFGQILTCEVIKDKKSGDSLQYAFIEFAEKESAEQAYFKMQNTLIDDRRIWVDFSQSVSKLHGDWLTKRLGGRKPPADKLVQEGGSGYGDRRDKSRPDSFSFRDRERDRERDRDRIDDRRRRDYDDNRYAGGSGRRYEGSRSSSGRDDDSRERRRSHYDDYDDGRNRKRDDRGAGRGEAAGRSYGDEARDSGRDRDRHRDRDRDRDRKGESGRYERHEDRRRTHDKGRDRERDLSPPRRR